jgi:hypothetical protein
MNNSYRLIGYKYLACRRLIKGKHPTATPTSLPNVSMFSHPCATNSQLSFWNPAAMFNTEITRSKHRFIGIFDGHIPFRSESHYDPYPRRQECPLGQPNYWTAHELDDRGSISGSGKDTSSLRHGVQTESGAHPGSNPKIVSFISKIPQNMVMVTANASPHW